MWRQPKDQPRTKDYSRLDIALGSIVCGFVVVVRLVCTGQGKKTESSSHSPMTEL